MNLVVTTRVPDPIGPMFQGGRLVRVDDDRRGIRTASGAQVGDTEARILELHGPRIRVRQHHYLPAGHHQDPLRCAVESSTRSTGR